MGVGTNFEDSVSKCMPPQVHLPSTPNLLTMLSVAAPRASVSPVCDDNMIHRVEEALCIVPQESSRTSESTRTDFRSTWPNLASTFNSVQKFGTGFLTLRKTKITRPV